MPAGADSRLQVHDSVLAYLEVYRDYASIFRAWWELLEPPNEFTNVWVAIQDRSRRELTAVIETGQKERIIDAAVDPATTADLILAVFERSAYVKIVLGWGDGSSDEELADLISRLLGHGLGAPAA
jgi:hypothetical protein